MRKFVRTIGVLFVGLSSPGMQAAHACVPYSSPTQTDWRRCAVAAIKKAGLKTEIAFTKGPNAYPPPHRQKVPNGFYNAVTVAERQCGNFDAATSKARKINVKRSAVGCASYVVVSYPDQLFSGIVREDDRYYDAEGRKQ